MNQVVASTPTKSGFSGLRRRLQRLMLVLAAVAGMANAAQAQSIKIDDTNFPDENFRNHVTNNYDKNSDGSLSNEEIAAVTTIDVSYKNIADLKGIEYFTALKELHCNGNQLTALDLSKNTALTLLRCHLNKLSTLDLSANTALTFLGCESNWLTTLNLSANTALTTLYCSYNILTSLNLSANTALTFLSCHHNQLTALDVTANTALTNLYCGSNQLTALDVSANTALTNLYCSSNQLTTLDLSANTALTELGCSSNKLTTLDLSANTALTNLYCSSNQLTTLDLSANTALQYLDCNGNQIQGDEMLALVNSLPTVTSGEFYVVNTQDSNEGNVITKAQVNIAKNKGWTVFDYAFKGQVEYAGVEEYELTFMVTGGGRLTATPNGNVGVGTEVTLTATPDEGYKIKTLRAYKTDDESQEVTISENKFTMPAYAVTVEAEFEILTYTLTYTAGENGSIQGQLTQTVQHGGSGEEVEAVPNGIYKFYRWSDGLSTAKRTDSNVKANLSVTAEFIDPSISIYSLTYTAGEGGRIKGTAMQNVAEGQSSIEVEAVPNEGYKFVKWSDGNTNAKRTESNVTANMSVTAEFEVIIYTLTYTAGENGSIQGQTTQTVQHGQSGEEVVAVPNDGYRFVKWSDGVTTAQRTDSNVQANLSVTAEFEKTATTGLFDVKRESLSAYPNPTQGVLWVSVPELAEGTAAEMHVYNTSGQLLQRVPAHGASTGSAASRLSIDLSGYPAGVYFIRVGNAMAKVVKQ